MTIVIVLFLTGSWAVTYFPRLLPFLILKTEHLSPFFRRFLSFMPVAALGALLIPGVKDAIPGESIASIIGVIVAGVVAWFTGGIVFPVAAAITAVFIVLLT